MHDLHIGQNVMFQEATSKQWYPATITSLCSKPRSYNITTRDGITYRKTHAHLKPYTPQGEKLEAEHSMSKLMVQSNNMWTDKQPEHKKSYEVNNQAQSYTSRTKRDIKPPVSLIYKVLCDNFHNILDIYCVNWIVHKWLPIREYNNKN